jgi:hypothetical protein
MVSASDIIVIADFGVKIESDKTKDACDSTESDSVDGVTE